MKVKENDLRVFENDTLFVMWGGKLQECKPLKTWFIKDFDGYTVKCSMKMPDGGIIQDVEYSEVFDSPSGYAEHTQAAVNVYTFNWVRHSIFHYDVISDFRVKDNTIYTFENGECVPNKICFDKFYYDYETNRWGCPDMDALKGVETYGTHDVACSFNTIKVVNKDGEESEWVGVNKLLELTEEQKELVGQLENIVRQLKDAGVYLAADTNDRYMAYNIKDVADVRIDYDEPSDDNGEYELALRYAKAFRVDIGYPQWSEDNDLYIKRKK